jgi:hypothetical protein
MARVPTGGDAMSNKDKIDRQIEELERFLDREDPSLSTRFSQPERGSTRNVVSLVVISVVLLAIGLATLSVVAFGIGAPAWSTS